MATHWSCHSFRLGALSTITGSRRKRRFCLRSILVSSVTARPPHAARVYLGFFFGVTVESSYFYSILLRSDVALPVPVSAASAHVTYTV